VLHEIAAASGVETTTEDAGDRVLADWEESRQRGLIGSPHVFAGDEAFVCPLLEISRIDGELRITGDASALVVRRLVASTYPPGYCYKHPDIRI
jgi:hypothetical protein